MRFPFASRSHDLDQIRATLPHLGRSATVAGVAAALSWNERRVEKAVREWERLEPMRVAFDPLGRTVRLLGAAPVELVAPPPSAPSPAEAAPVARSMAAPAPPSTWATVNCRSCGSAMEPTGTGSGLFCPGCGRLGSRSSANAAPPPLPNGPAPPATKVAPAVQTGTGHAVSDTKAQEMFAAWATSRPIPCPRCRAGLRHDGVGKYRCLACGESVRFLDDKTGPVVSAPPAAAPPAA